MTRYQPQPAAQPDLLAVDFTLETAAAVRRAVASCTRRHLPADAADGFVLAIGEIIANAVVHGGGGGSLRLWRGGEAVHCQVRDQGAGIAAHHMRPERPPSVTACSGRGIWMAHQLCSVAFTTGPRGTTVRLTSAACAAQPAGVRAARAQHAGLN